MSKRAAHSSPQSDSPAAKRFCNWSVDEVKKQLKLNGLPSDLADKFKENGIDGKKLEALEVDDLTRILHINLIKSWVHVPQKESLKDEQTFSQYPKKLDEMARLLGVIDNVKQGKPLDSKVFNDPIHGHIELHPLCVAIVDTPQFQRLRNLKQLGAGYLSTRGPHTIVLNTVLEQLTRALKERQIELNITDKDILCVQIAGLCHDLGHGPFSHVFDNMFIPRVAPKSKWKHEDASVKMFEYMCEKNTNLGPLFEEYGLDTNDLVFIKEMIKGLPDEYYQTGSTEKVWKQEGRSEEKAFLYEIVANKRNGIDVDKWDYFARDCHHLGMNSSFDHQRFIKFARVLRDRDDKQRQICYREKEAFNIYQLFYTRLILYRRAYQHKTVKTVELMLVDAMTFANEVPEVRILDEETKERNKRPSDCIEKMSAYINLTDNIFHQILATTSEGSEELSLRLTMAQRILKRIQERKLYECIFQSEPIPGSIPVEELKRRLNLGLLEENLIFEVATFDFGKKDKNPVDSVLFYSKTDSNTPKRKKAEEVSYFISHEVFKEQILWIISRDSDDINEKKKTELIETSKKWLSDIKKENMNKIKASSGKT